MNKLAVFVVSVLSVTGQAATTLFDFETDALPYRVRGQTKLDTVPDFATSGKMALRFTSLAWKRGMPEWPSFEFKTPLRNWSGYDRLVVDITNPSEEQFSFAMFVSDSKVPFRQGLHYSFALPSHGWKRFMVPLSSFPKTVNRADIAIVHFFTTRPTTDLALYLDNITLLKKGETLPLPGPEFERQLAPLKRAQLAAREAARAKRAAAIAQLQPSGKMFVGYATSMEKILPRDGPLDLKPARKFEVSLARNEKESFQVLVVPAKEALRKVSVSVSDLKSATGAVFPRTQIDCDVVGYVETKQRPPYGSECVGWWPDSILNFLGPVDIAAGDVQAFWIRVRAPKDQKPGLYRGTLTVSADGAWAQSFVLTVRVRSFTLPDRSPLPLAITFAPHDHPTDETRAEQTEWRKSAEYPLNAWRKQKQRWADFLADYYITYDSLYHHEQPDFEILSKLHQQNRLNWFNLGYWDYIGSDLEKWKSKNLPRFRDAYTTAKKLGLLDHAYLYGCDEVVSNYFPQVEQAAAILKAEFPGTLIMTTTYDQSYGQQSVIKSVDAFCPLTPKFDPTKAATARAAGKQVWWYICCGPRHPQANMFVEYPAIEGRLLMGAMTAKQRPDGFLYYQISIWNSRHPITTGPFTNWDPRSWTTYHGDGSWTCVGPDGVPVPTIRLENFRDGLEDFAYARILEDFTVPESLVKTMTEYSRDPAELYAWRNAIADAIERGGTNQNKNKPH